MKKGAFSLMLGISLMICLVVSCNMMLGNQKVDTQCVECVEVVDIVEFELIRDSLYDCAMTICTGLSECDGSCFFTDVDKASVNEFIETRVPSLELLLFILDQIDMHGSVYDVYDDDKGTVFEYYSWREKYENCF